MGRPCKELQLSHSYLRDLEELSAEAKRLILMISLNGLVSCDTLERRLDCSIFHILFQWRRTLLSTAQVRMPSCFASITIGS